MGGASKPLIPFKSLMTAIKSTASTQWHLAAMGAMFLAAGGLVVGATINAFNKPEVGWIRSRRAKYGQYDMITHEKPTNLLFQTAKMASVYKTDPHLASLYGEIYEGGKFDL